MIDRPKAETIADDFVRALARPADGYRISRRDPILVEPGWYFDYEILCDLNIPKEDQEKFTDAFGIVIDKVSGDVSEISHSQWVDLGLAFHPNPYGDDA